MNAVIPLRDDTPARRAPLVTWALIAVNVLVFVYQSQLPDRALQHLIETRALIPARYTHPEAAAHYGVGPDGYLSFLTSMFLHGSWLHVIGNMWFLWIFGDNVEDRMGHVRFLLFYVLCGLAAGGLHVLTNGNSLAPTVGASGAIAGVLGAYFLLFPRARVLTLVPIVFIPLFFELPAVTFLLIWFGLQVIQGWAGMGAEAGGVAWWAHVGGFGAGILLHRLFLERAPPRPRWSSRRYADD